VTAGELTGQTLGRFRLGPLLGAGGMGVVYLAEDTELGRRVAVKLLPRELVGDPNRRARFLLEARAAAAIRPPGIAVIHDIAESGGRVLIIMEYVEGESLRALVSRTRLPLARALDLSAMLAEAVSAAHSAGIVHRDLKPENLMLDRDSRLRVLDFGIAKLDPASYDGSAPIGPAMTREGASIGTPGYMSPEQVRGLSADWRADLFSIGVVLYELVTGHPPFVGPTPVDVAASSMRDEPPRPSGLDPRVPPALEALILRCLAKDPQARPASAAEIGHQLRRIERDLTSVELGATLATDGSLFPPGGNSTPYAGAIDAIPRRRPAAWLLALGVGLLISLVAIAAVLAVRARASSIAVAAPLIASIEAPAPALREPEVGVAALASYLTRTDSKRETSNTVPAWDSAARDFERAAEQPGAPVRWRSARYFAEGQRQLLGGDLSASKQSFERAARAEPDWALPQVGLAALFDRQNDQPQALAAARRAEQLDPKLWLAVRAAARAYLMVPDFPSAISELRRALVLSPNNALLLSELALAYHGALMDDEAERQAKRALELDPDLVSVHVLLAERALERNRAKVALDHATSATANDPTNVPAWLAKADALLLLGRKSDAARAYDEAIRLRKQTKQTGGPSARLEEVERVRKQGGFPVPRHAAASPTTLTRTQRPPKASRSHKPDRFE
jgi:tetratricopeptide (TPR) repeat protein